MASQSAHRDGHQDDGGGEIRGQLLYFPDRRSFGPLSWRTVRLASLIVLLLLVSNALIEMVLWRSLGEVRPAVPKAARVAS